MATMNRREWLRRMSGAAAGTMLARCGLAAESEGFGRVDGSFLLHDQINRLSEHLAVYHGAINVGIIRDGDRAWLIDCGDAAVLPAVMKTRTRRVEQVLFTHHHRDQACGAGELVANGAKLLVPEAERKWFEKVKDYWNDPRTRWHIYQFHPHRLMLAESLPVADVVRDGQTLELGPARVHVLATPGHTDGSVSYLVEVDGRRVVFCGDAIYDAGQVWDIHSLQKGTQTKDYHGFLGARAELKESLARIKAQQPGMLVPSHGRIMSEPGEAIDLVCRRLDQCYDRYVAISALRHYFPKMFTEYVGRPGHMPIGPSLAVPDCLRHFGTTWVLVSRDKSALVMDCGSSRVVKWLQDLLAKGEIRKIEGLWITHYHDDHVSGVPEFQKTFDCPCITDRHVADVIADPLAWRLPCIDPGVTRVDRPTGDGQSWQWHEFRLTAHHFPGQTLYHSGLQADRDDLRLLFTGDSFTMAGIDDYCPENRTFLGADVGFDRCLQLIAKIRPTHMFNCHVSDAFTFTPDECRFMRDNLAERERLFGELLPWDHANYGLDESWVRCHPYEQRVAAGARVEFDVVLTNHSSGPSAASCRVRLPRAMQPSGAAAQDSMWTDANNIAPRADGGCRLAFAVPPGTPPGRYVIPVDVRYAGRRLPQFTEAVVEVAGP